MITTLLAGDIGGTKTLLSLYSWDGTTLELCREERFVSGQWDDLAPMVQHFLSDPDSQGPAAACLAVAGPVQGGQARLTNLPWRLSESALAAACGIPRVELVNDFAVLLYGLPHLGNHQLAAVREGTAVPGEPLLILGAGTGLGVALGIPTAAGLRADLDLERLSIERVVSGTGLGHVACWFLHKHDPQGQHPLQEVARRWRGSAAKGPGASADGSGPADLPAAVSEAAIQGEPLASEAMELWLSAYGSVVGDLALTSLSRGGIWLAGGTAAKLLAGLRSRTFAEAFLAKGRLRPTLEPLPIQAVIDPKVGSFSAACRARALLA